MKKRLLASCVLFIVITPLSAQQPGKFSIFGDRLAYPGRMPAWGSGMQSKTSTPLINHRFDRKFAHRMFDPIMFAALSEGDQDRWPNLLDDREKLGAWSASVSHRISQKFLMGGAFAVRSSDTDIDGGDQHVDHQQLQPRLNATLVEDRRYIASLTNIGFAEASEIRKQAKAEAFRRSGNTEDFIFGVSLAARHFARIDDIQPLALSIGTALTLDWPPDLFGEVRLRFSALLNHELEDDDRKIDSSFVTNPIYLEKTVAEGDQTRSQLGADIGFQVTEGLGFSFSYETLVNLDDGDDHSIIGRAVINF